jgi:hypothetical protein
MQNMDAKAEYSEMVRGRRRRRRRRFVAPRPGVILSHLVKSKIICYKLPPGQRVNS